MKTTTKKSDLKSAHRFVVTLWSAKHYGTKLKKSTDIFHGYVEDKKSKEKIHFHGLLDFITLMNKLYRKNERN